VHSSPAPPRPRLDRAVDNLDFEVRRILPTVANVVRAIVSMLWKITGLVRSSPRQWLYRSYALRRDVRIT